MTASDRRVRVVLPCVVLASTLLLTGCGDSKLQERCAEAIAMMDRGELEAAVAMLSRQLRETPGEPEPLLLRAEANYQCKEYQAALEDLLVLKEKAESETVAHLRGVVLQHASNHQAAVEELQQLVDSEDAELAGKVRRDLAKSCLALARFEEALEALEHTTVERDEEFYLLYGRAHSGKRDLESAEQSFSDAIEVEPKSAEAYFERSLIRKAMGKDLLALEDRQMANALSPHRVSNTKLRDLVGQFRGEVAARSSLLKQ